MKIRKTKHSTTCDRYRSRWATFDYQMPDGSCACLCDVCLQLAIRQEIDTICRQMATAGED